MNEILDHFRKTGALLEGHFILRSGLHSREFFQCALLLQYTKIAERICGMLAEKLHAFECETIVSPALGGIIVGQEVARHLGKRHIFVEKNDQGGLVLRRGFTMQAGEKIVIAEDVITRGGRIRQTIDVIRALGGMVMGAGCIVDRSSGLTPEFGCPFVSLIQMNVENFEADKLPPDLAMLPVMKPGSK